ncbi:MAG: hypothetical protein ACJAZP_000818 [Psychromonas sp.]|jgi:hypothetical protein|uniref:ATP-binding protein n=1 Tax=Psychromonas sp. TaxID=1884585 RepID=UPI0039E504E6
MAQQAYQLLRIIIIDSFWKGQVNELNLTGHTQLEGTNGAGKTSLMRLLPLFYGMRPSDIVSKVDQARNFADYYLPRDSSMLVYEYQRPFGQTCMVIASSEGRGVHFKFIDGAYNSDYFIADNNKPYRVRDVEKFYRNAGCDCSVFLGVDKYRQVIQNLRSGRKVKDVYLLQKRYSFSDQPCPHIDKVINGTIEKNLDFDAVKRMLVAIASDHLARNTVDEKEQISLKKEEISHWLADIQAGRAIQKVADKITLWQNDFSSLESLLLKLQHLHFEIIEHQKRLLAVQQERGETKTAKRQLLISLEKQLQDSVDRLNAELFTLKAKIEADQSRINLLDEDKLIFDQDDAPSYHLHAAQAPHIQNQLNEVNAIIEAFEGNINKIQQKFDRFIQDRKLEHVTEIAGNKDKTANIKETASLQLTVISEVYQQQCNELNEQLNQQNLNLKIGQQQIENALQNAQFQLNQAIIEPELLADIENNQVLLNAAQEKQTQRFKEQSALHTELTQFDKSREKQSDKYKQENRYLEQLRSERLEIDLQRIPKKGSLHDFLNNEPLAGDWKQSIGRLLSSAQLGRCDLDPSWVGGELSFYGLQLDLQQIQNNDSLLLDETQLREKRDALETTYLTQVEKIKQLDEHIAQLSKQIENQQLRITQAAQGLKQNELTLQQLKAQHQHLAVKKQLAVKAHIDSVNEQIHSLENQKKAHDKKQLAFTELQQDQKSELNNQMLEKRMVVESDRDVQLELLSESLLSLESSHKTRIKELQKQKNTDLNKLDPDGEVDKRSQERKVLIKALEKCAVFEQKARSYLQFMNERYSHRDSLVEHNQNRNINKRNIEQSIEECQINLGTQISDTRVIIKKLNMQIHASEELLLLLNDSHRDCEQNGINATFAEHQPTNQADLSISFCNDCLTQFKSIHKRLNEQLNKFNERFKKDHSASELYENWQKLVAENDQYQGAELLFKYRSPIADLLSSAEQKQKSTYQLVTVNANMINEFYQHIENFGHRIKQIGKKLSTNVTALTHFEALADINVTTVMKQEELDYWGPLQVFAKAFELYRDQLRDGSGEIPDELVHAMQRLSAYLPSEGFALAHNNLFDIEFTITEKGQVKHARNAKQLKKVSSTGLSYLAMLSLFAGLLGMLRGTGENSSQIILPVDELGELAAENVDLLLQMFNDNNISILSASPSTDRHILSLYQRHYKLKDNKIFHAGIPASRLDELLAQRANAQKNHDSSVIQDTDESIGIEQSAQELS